MASVERESGEETVIEVPEELALFSLGFAIDAGGSVTKVLFRSKEDYSNGRRIGKTEVGEGVGLLRMRHFASDDSEGLIRFLCDRCDVMESVRSGTQADAWFQTGVRTQWFMQQLDAITGTNVKTKLLSEVDGLCKGLFRFYPLIRNRRQMNISPSAVESVLETSRNLLKTMEKFKVLGGDSFSDGLMGGDPRSVEEYIGKMMTTDAETFAKELSHQDVEFPALCVICGSANAIFLIKEDRKYQPGNFSGVSGKTFLALGKLLCAAKDFDELVYLASRGDHHMVDTLTEDLRLDDRDGDDWYNVMPDNFVIFSLGKMAEEKHREAYTREDMAAGVLHLVISTIAKLVTTTARLLKAKSIVLTGSLLNRQMAREAMQKWILQDLLMLPLSGEDEIKCIFVDHPGFICVFGTWFHNWEQEQERRKRENEKQ